MVKPRKQSLWASYWESMTLESLELLEFELLREQLHYMYDRSEFYRSQLALAGLRVGDITDRAVLSRVPLTEKRQLAEYQRQGDLFGPHQCASLEDIIRVVGTGGTSGLPMRLGWTRNDVEIYSEMGARALWTAGVRPTDFFINCFNYSIYAGGVMDHISFERIGASILPYGVGNSSRLLQMLLDIRTPLSLYSTPSYAVRLAEVAEQQRVDRDDIGFIKAVFSGEAGLQVSGYRDRIEQLWNMTTNDLFGLAELGVQSAECEYRQGMHYSGAGLVFLEIIDGTTRAPLALEDGVIGEAVYSTLRREACPLLRFRSHDLVQLFTKPCDCGRSSPRLKILGRTDDMFVVKGVNVFPLAIQQVLTNLSPTVTGEFQIVLSKPPPFDYAPLLIVEKDRGDEKQIRGLVKEAIRMQLGITFDVQVTDRGTIVSEHKTQRVLRKY